MKYFTEFIKEGISNSYDFTTKMDDKNYDINIWYISEYLNKEVGEKPTEARINWRIEPELRSDRIKSMNLMIQNVYCEIEWVTDDESDEGVLTLDTTLPEFNGWEIENEIEFDKWGGVMPKSVEIDFRRKTITVS